MSDHKITLSQLKSYGPCYSPEKLATCAAGRSECLLSDIVRREDIPTNDRLWVVINYWARVDRVTLVEFARWCAESAQTIADADADLAYAARAAAFFARSVADRAFAAAARAAVVADPAAAAFATAAASHAAADAAAYAAAADQVARAEDAADIDFDSAVDAACELAYRRQLDHILTMMGPAGVDNA